MRKLLITAILGVSSLVFSQAVPKDTIASQTLNQIAKSKTDDQKVLDAKFQQARATLDANTKAINDQIATVSKDLNEKVHADKKYKPLFDQLDSLQKQQTEAHQKAQDSFNAEIGPIQQKVVAESNQIDGLIPIVKKESGFPDNAIFDPTTQKWSIPEVKK